MFSKAAMRSPHSLLFSRLNTPSSLSLYSQEQCSSPQIIFKAPLWTRSNSSVSFLCLGPPGLDAALQVGPHEGREERYNPRPCTTAIHLLV